MVASINGHPFGDIRAILNNTFDPGPLNFVFQSDVTHFTYSFNHTGLSQESSSRYEEIVLDAFAELSAYTNLTFERANDGGFPSSHISFAHQSSLGSGGEAYHTYWDNGGDGDVETIRSEVRVGTEGVFYYIIVHEIGHALTLLHTGPDQDPEHLPFVEPQYQNNNYTVMHYVINDGLIQADGEWSYDTYQLLDIYALQLRFGANMSTYSGDDIHTQQTIWSPDDQGFLQPIWDAGGLDELNFSEYDRDQLIDLREGHFSDVGAFQGASPWVDLTVGDPLDMDYTLPLYNLSITYGTIIENASGGSGDDMIIGNDANNSLYGTGGADTLIGGGGDDTLIAGESGDPLVGSLLEGGAGDDLLMGA